VYIIPTPATAMIGPATDHVVVSVIGLPPTNPNPCNANSTPERATRTPTPRRKVPEMVLTTPRLPLPIDTVRQNEEASDSA
tara:strand:+ start:226 stop:468 length:243 start_codon:yes stop_codon:yes gene_type:complete